MIAHAVGSWLHHRTALCEFRCESELNSLASATFAVAELLGPGGLLAHLYHLPRMAQRNQAPPFVAAAYLNLTAFEVALLRIAMPALPIIAAALFAKTVRVLIHSGILSCHKNDNVMAIVIWLFSRSGPRE